MQIQQDWEPVVFTKKKEHVKPQGPSGNPQKKFDTNAESFEHKKIPKYISDAIKQTRLDQKLTQDQLAKKINERSCVISEIESMKCVYNHVTVNKILKALGLSLKNIRK